MPSVFLADTSEAAWGTSTVDSTTSNITGPYSSIAVGTSGAAYISYMDFSNYNLMYATNLDGSWGMTTLDNVGTFDGTDTYYYDRSTSIAVGSSGAAYISYYHYGSSSLRYATKVSGGAWGTETVDNTSSADTGKFNSIAVGTSGAVYISYYDVSNTALMCATKVSGAWGTDTVDNTSSADTGKYSSIAVGTSGAIYISYFDNNNYNLMYATKVSGAWGTTTMDSTGDTGEWTSIAVGTSGAVYISYYDVDNTNLRYAANPTHTAVTGAASGVSTSGATLGGTANATGLATTAFFQYGASSGTYTGTSSTQSASGTSDTAVSIALSGLSAGTTYYYRLANQHYTNLVYGSEASFTTSSSGGGGEPVKEKLTISSTSPSSGVTGVSVTTSVSATFNLLINGATVTTDSFTLSGEGGSVSGSVVTNGSTITFTPSLALSYGTKYTATVTTKVQAANAAGTTMESAYSWDFTTESLIAVTPTTAVTATPAATPTATVTPVPSPTSTVTSTPVPTLPPEPSPTVTAAPTLPPKPTSPPVPTPTVSIAPTPVATATPTPAECVPESMTVSSYKLNLKMKSSKAVTVTVTGSDGCLVEGDIVEAKIIGYSGKYISISPKKATTDANGQARFKIKARKTKGKATVSFTCEEIEETVTVKVVK